MPSDDSLLKANRASKQIIVNKHSQPSPASGLPHMHCTYTHTQEPRKHTDPEVQPFHVVNTKLFVKGSDGDESTTAPHHGSAETGRAC